MVSTSRSTSSGQIDLAAWRLMRPTSADTAVNEVYIAVHNLARNTSPGPPKAHHQPGAKKNEALVPTQNCDKTVEPFRTLPH